MKRFGTKKFKVFKASYGEIPEKTMCFSIFQHSGNIKSFQNIHFLYFFEYLPLFSIVSNFLAN